MTQPHDAPAAAGESATGAPERAATPRGRAIAIGLAGALILIVVVGTAPLWAPLLPWGASPAATPADAALGPRIDRLEAAQQLSEEQRRPEESAGKAALQLLDRRVGALEARPTMPASDLADLRQQVTKLSNIAADLAARVEALDKAVHTPAAADTTNMALVLALLQIRGAVEAGRPFAAEYEALAALARTRPEIAAAATPLAEPAKTGVAGRAVLASRLRELAGAIATANSPPNAPTNAPTNADGAAPDWADRALSRLSGLVTIRRIEGAGQGQPRSGPAAAVNAAELALGGGDLPSAVAALDTLAGAPADAARPWLRMARQRLAVEAALTRIEALLVARLGPSAGAATGPGSPR